MERELETSGKMTWAFIWRFILYYIAISIVLAVITYFMLGKANMLVLSIFSIITMGILIFFPTKLATSDLFKTKKMDSINLKKFKRNIVIFYIIVMMIVTLFNTLNYAVTMIGLENVNESAIEEIKNNENLQEEEKNKMIESQNNYIEQVEKIQRETFIIITLIDIILFILGIIIQFRYTKKYLNEED
ncbi:MAG: hypothetical protein ACLSW4_04665 [Clostridia bacterium]|jgi:hypothetical protein|nr:hypothetical protein [Clostridiaceae bacterium]